MADEQVALGGKVYDDEAQAVALTHPNIPEELRRVYITKDETPPTNTSTEETGRSVSGVPLGSTEKPAGALLSDLGTGVAPETQASPEPPQEPLQGLGNLSIVNAVQGMMNPSFDEDKKMISGFYDQVKSAFGLTQAPEWAVDQKTGEVHTSPQAIEKAADLANLMTFGPAPVAAKMVDGNLGSFMGVKSKTLDKGALYRAQNMEMDGVHPDDVWKSTQTFKGADGRWRQEIPDNDVNILDKGTTLHPAEATPKGIDAWTRIEKPEMLSIKDSKPSLPENAGIEDIFKYLKAPEMDVRLGHVLDHPKLYEAYPFLKNTKIYPMPKDLPYNGMVRGNEIYMRKLPTEDFTSTLMHEVQHVIQQHEGFASGANPASFIPPELNIAEQQFKTAREDAMKSTERTIGTMPDTVEKYKDWVGRFDKGELKPGTIPWQTVKDIQGKWPDIYNRLSNIAKSEDLLFKAKTEAHQKYESVMGEVESRNVQARLNLNALDRLVNSPRTTEDMIKPRALQIHPNDISAHRVGNF